MNDITIAHHIGKAVYRGSIKINKHNQNRDEVQKKNAKREKE